MREAYRLNQELVQITDQRLQLAFIYSAKEVIDFHFIQEKLILGLKRLSNTLSQNHDNESQKD